MRRIAWAETAKNLGAVLPLHVLVVCKTQVCLVHQSGCLEAVAGALAFHVPAGEAVEFLVDDGGEKVEGTLIASAPGAEERTYGVAATSIRHRAIIPRL